MSEVAVLGTGHAGLATAAVLSHIGHHVVVADADRKRIASLARGDLPLVEPGLEDAIRSGLDSGRIEFVTSAADAVREAEFVLICLRAPHGDDGNADMTTIEATVREIRNAVQPRTVVAIRSTVPVGTTFTVARWFSRGDVQVLSNPSFLRAGSALHDALHPDRIIIGSEDQAAAIRLAQLYSELKAPVVITDSTSAETIKYACNAFLATKVSFVNAIADLCESVGADVREVVVGMGYDHRIGFEFLKPGPGWSLPNDAQALIRVAEENGYDFSLLRGVVEVNDEQFERTADKIEAAAGGSLDGKVVAVWGLTFKARTDDTRDSPAIEVINRLVKRGATVRAYDPAARNVPSSVECFGDAYAASEGADVVAVLTEWDEFRWYDLDRVASVMRGRAIVDARNLLNPAAVRRRGFAYTGVGIP